MEKISEIMGPYTFTITDDHFRRVGEAHGGPAWTGPDLRKHVVKLVIMEQCPHPGEIVMEELAGPCALMVVYPEGCNFMMATAIPDYLYEYLYNMGPAVSEFELEFLAIDCPYFVA